MMSEDITRKKLTTGMSWVQRFSRARPASLLSSLKLKRAVINRKSPTPAACRVKQRCWC